MERNDGQANRLHTIYHRREFLAFYASTASPGPPAYQSSQTLQPHNHHFILSSLFFVFYFLMFYFCISFQIQQNSCFIKWFFFSSLWVPSPTATQFWITCFPWRWFFKIMGSFILAKCLLALCCRIVCFLSLPFHISQLCYPSHVSYLSISRVKVIYYIKKEKKELKITLLDLHLSKNTLKIW